MCYNNNNVLEDFLKIYVIAFSFFKMLHIYTWMWVLGEKTAGDYLFAKFGTFIFNLFKCSLLYIVFFFLTTKIK